MDGNQSHPSDDVSGFYENVLDYFNVDDLSELKAGVRIINGGTSKKNIEFFNKKFIKVDDYSLWRTEELLPITVLQKSMIERNESIAVSLYDRCYSITADSSFNISVEDTDEAYKTMVLEDFTLINNFNGSNFHSNSDEVRELKSQLYEYKSEIESLTKLYRENQQNIYELEQKYSLLNNYNVENGEDLKRLLLSLKYRDSFERVLAFDFINKDIGCLVMIGQYNNKPIPWRIIDITDDGYYLLSEYIITNSVFDSTNKNNWSESELRRWLNNEFYNEVFSEFEKEKIVKIGEDNIRLLSKFEAERLKSNIPKVSGCWWLLTHIPHIEFNGFKVYNVSNDTINDCSCKAALGVRPVLYYKY